MLVVVGNGRVFPIWSQSRKVKSGPALRIRNREEALQGAEQFRIIDLEVAEVGFDAKDVPNREINEQNSAKVTHLNTAEQSGTEMVRSSMMALMSTREKLSRRATCSLSGFDT